MREKDVLRPCCNFILLHRQEKPQKALLAAPALVFLDLFSYFEINPKLVKNKGTSRPYH
jgi:hypothetical protein